MKLRTRGFTGTTTDTITVRETEHGELARQAAEEGFVLLKLEEDILPLKSGQQIGLYGAGAGHTMKGGTGSGDVNERKSVSIYDGLKQKFAVTSEEWITGYDQAYEQAREDWKQAVFRKTEEFDGNFFEGYSRTPFYMPDGPQIDPDKARGDGADLAVYVLARIAGENADRKDIPGDYYASEAELKHLEILSECYDNIVLVLNTGGLVDLAFTEKFPKIKAIVQYVQAGQQGGNALARVLSGEVSPSGKLVDSWAPDYKDYPNAATFSFKSGNIWREDYIEDIYVGYRYFDTFEKPVRYCFGYGLSYTDFAIQTKEISLLRETGAMPRIQVTADVTNVGETYAGKEVVQVYVSCPQTELMKEFRRLAAFGKTRELKPGEVQSLSLLVTVEQLTSYCEKRNAYVLEAGDYGIWVGNSLENAVLAGVMKLDDTVEVTRCESICQRKEDLHTLTPDLSRLKERQQQWQAMAAERNLSRLTLAAADVPTRQVEYTTTQMRYDPQSPAGQIVERLSTEQLIALSSGDPSRDQGAQALGSAGQTVPGAAAETSEAAKEQEQVASVVLADGPAGLRLRKTYTVHDGIRDAGDFLDGFEGGFFAAPKKQEGVTMYQFCTAIPVGTLLAQSWNVELVRDLGAMIGKEMQLFEVSLWLAPGMNIHRNPLCGRNFEYYSEDPLVAGIMASAMTLGVQSVPGCGTTIKHFACNNCEDNRMGVDEIVSQRALREIYLKGFEIAVKNAQPMSIMTSYNMINGVHAANNYDLCTKAARDEWGFAGVIMTDWTTTTASTAGECTADGCIRAGNDWVMPGAPEDHEQIHTALTEGYLTIEELKDCICNGIRIILQTNQYENAVSYSRQFAGLDTYMKEQ